MKIISREEAKALGLKRFFIGQPCTYGHLCERLVSNNWCVLCGPRYKATYAIKGGERVRQLKREHSRRTRSKDPIGHNKAIERAKAKKPEHYKDLHRQWVEKNRQHVREEKSKEKRRAYAAYSAAREMGIVDHSKKSFTQAQVEEMRRIYQENMMPSGWVKRGTLTAIAEQFQASRSTIGTIVHKKDLKPRYYYKKNRTHLRELGRAYSKKVRIIAAAVREILKKGESNDDAR